METKACVQIRFEVVRHARRSNMRFSRTENKQTKQKTKPNQPGNFVIVNNTQMNDFVTSGGSSGINNNGRAQRAETISLHANCKTATATAKHISVGGTTAVLAMVIKNEFAHTKRYSRSICSVNNNKSCSSLEYWLERGARRV